MAGRSSLERLWTPQPREGSRARVGTEEEDEEELTVRTHVPLGARQSVYAIPVAVLLIRLLVWQLRAVVVGLVIGVLLACTNSYFGLQTGWISMMSLQASLLGFAVFKVLPQSGLFDNRPLTIHENVSPDPAPSHRSTGPGIWVLYLNLITQKFGPHCRLFSRRRPSQPAPFPSQLDSSASSRLSVC